MIWLLRKSAKWVVDDLVIGILLLGWYLLQHFLLFSGRRSWSHPFVWKIHLIDVFWFIFDRSYTLLISDLSKSSIKRIFSISSKILFVDFSSNWICNALRNLIFILFWRAVDLIKLPPTWINHSDLFLLFNKSSRLLGLSLHRVLVDSLSPFRWGSTSWSRFILRIGSI